MQQRKPNYLPTELVDDILVRLPVKPLLRFRCVSKRCLALIDSLEFIKLHLNCSIETRNNRNLIVSSFLGNKTFSVNVDSTDVAIEIDHPLKDFHVKSLMLMGSCNGLVLLSYLIESRYDHTVIIWNPSTRYYHELDIAGFDSSYNARRVRYSIGYVPIHDDYKVVRMNQSFGKVGTEVNIYSLKSNTWRRVHDFPYNLWNNELFRGVSAGGALHWVVFENRSSDSGCIGAFDLVTEEYRLVPMPNIGDDKKGVMRIAVVEGCLCILCNHCRDVWVMKSYGVSDSWTKLVLQKDGGWLITPLAFSKDGREVLLVQNRDKLIRYDLESNAPKIVDVRDLPSIFQFAFVTQSLVPLGRNGSGS